MFEAPILDTRRFTACAERVEGSLRPDLISALEGSLHGHEGEIHWTVQGGADGQGRREIRIAVSGFLWLTCQRCLQGVRFDLDSHSILRLVEREDELPDLEDEDEAIETMVLPDKLVVVDLVSEEVVLALPLAPAHPEGSCELAKRDGVAREGRPHPFAGLGVLKQDN